MNDNAPQGTSLPTMTVNLDTCTGCRMCVMMCSLTKTGGFSASRARVAVVKRKAEVCKEAPLTPSDGDGVPSGLEVIKDVPLICHQCADAPCLAACPTEAISRDSSTSAVLVEQQACSLCLACIAACPYEAIFLQEERIAICDLCGGKPVCVRYCSYGTLQFPLKDEPEGDEDDDFE